MEIKKQWKQNEQIWWEKERKGRMETQSWIEIDKEDLYILKINYNGKRTVGKAKE